MTRPMSGRIVLTLVLAVAIAAAIGFAWFKYGKSEHILDEALSAIQRGTPPQILDTLEAALAARSRNLRPALLGQRLTPVVILPIGDNGVPYPLWRFGQFFHPASDKLENGVQRSQYLLISPGLGQTGARTDWPCKIILTA